MIEGIDINNNDTLDSSIYNYRYEIMKKFEDRINNQKDLDPELQDVINNNIWGFILRR